MLLSLTTSSFWNKTCELSTENQLCIIIVWQNLPRCYSEYLKSKTGGLCKF